MDDRQRRYQLRVHSRRRATAAGIRLSPSPHANRADRRRVTREQRSVRRATVRGRRTVRVGGIRCGSPKHRLRAFLTGILTTLLTRVDDDGQPEHEPVDTTDPPTPPRLADVPRCIAAPRPGPAVGVTVAA